MDTQITIVWRPEHWEDLESELEAVLDAGLDIETTPVPWHKTDFRILTVAISTAPGHAYVIPCAHPEATDREALQKLYTMLKRIDQPRWIMQNGAFDYVALKAIGIELRTPWFDPMVAQYLIDVEARKGLTDLAARYLGIMPWKDIDYSKPEEESLDVLARLNGRDADYTLRLMEPLTDALQRERKEKLYHKLMMPASLVLCEMEMMGIPVDADRLGDLLVEVEEELDSLLNDIKKMAGDENFNPNSTRQLANLLYKTYGLPVEVWTDKGAPSTNKEALGKLENDHPIIPLIQRHRGLRKLFTASLVPWWDGLRNDKLYPRYKPAFVKTGRLSSEMPNIQQVPREQRVRRIFGGHKGELIIEADYSQLELRIVAWLADEKTMLNAFYNGEDLHQLTADSFGVDRQTAKALNFGLLYGAGARKLMWIAEEQYGVTLSMLQAESLRAQWFAKYPAIEVFHKQEIEGARILGGTYSALGRWRPLEDINHDDWGKKAHAERQAINTPVQSLASDLTLVKLTQLYNDMDLRLMGVRPVATVHDSILFTAPNAEAVDYIKKVMEDTSIFMELFGIDINVPLTVDTKVGTHWGEYEA